MNEAKNILIVGAPGAGKSSLIGKYIHLMNPKERLMILSTFKDRSIIRQTTRQIPTKKITSQNLNSITHFKEDRLYLVVTDLLPKEVNVLEDKLSLLRNCTLIVDEARMFLNTPSDSFIRFYRAARHYGIETITSTQRLIDISPDIRAVFTDIFMFHISAFRDLSVLAEELPQKEYITQIQTLPHLHYLYIDKQHGIILPGIITF